MSDLIGPHYIIYPTNTAGLVGKWLLLWQSGVGVGDCLYFKTYSCACSGMLFGYILTVCFVAPLPVRVELLDARSLQGESSEARSSSHYHDTALEAVQEVRGNFPAYKRSSSVLTGGNRS
jgi:hypothetical protein